MNKLLGLVFLLFIFASCLEVRFENSQPVDNESLIEFPEEVIGTYKAIGELSQDYLAQVGKSRRKRDKYSDTVDTAIRLEIKQESIIFPFLLEEKFIKKDFVLKRLSDYDYVLSMNFVDTIENSESWLVFPFSVSNDSLTIYTVNFIPANERQIVVNNIEKIVPIKRIYSKPKKSKRKRTQVEKLEYYMIDPTEDEFLTLIDRNIFRDWVSFKKEK